MILSKKINKVLSFILVTVLAGLLIINPKVCEKSVAYSIILCSRVLIPSLFPFGVCMLYIIKSGITEKLNFIYPVTRLLKLTPFAFVIMVMSMLGGYPIGAKLINEAVIQGSLSSKDARRLLNFCVNAGPGFIVSAVGVGLLKNQKIGYLLLVSHITASLLICIFSKGVNSSEKNTVKNLNPIENFVTSAGESANAILSICGFVILFGVITAYIEYYSRQLKILKPLIYIAEITTAITKTNNIYLISFLLGFAGICIWSQVLCVGKNIKINVFYFALHRILHGLLSGSITYFLIKVFKISQSTFSNSSKFAPNIFVSGTALGISLVILGLVFIISLSSKQKNAKILEEFI